MQRILTCLIVLFLSVPVVAAERLPLEQVDLDAMIRETQKDASQQDGSGLVWFMPEVPFFRLLSEGGNIPPREAAAIRSMLKGKCVVIVVRAHISPFGSFTYFDEDTILAGTKISVQKPNRDEIVMRQLTDIPPDLTLIFNAMKPVLKNAIGPMGENMYFYVYDNVAADGSAIYDPYKDEQVRVSFTQMGRLPENTSTHDTICDSLFKPRVLKNGKRAHVTWKFDPWTGDKLPE